MNVKQELKQDIKKTLRELKHNRKLPHREMHVHWLERQLHAKVEFYKDI